MLKFFLLLCCTASLLACSNKDVVDKGCWQGFDPAGVDIPGLLICDVTKAEAEARFPSSWFYRSDEPKFCWQVISPQQSSYMRHVPLSMVDMMRPRGGWTFNKVDCNSFCHWEWHEKVRNKQTGQYGQTRARWEYYVSDSCSKLFVGRVIVINETVDSIYTMEFIRKEP
jgi:hypothetical protein